MRKIPTSSITIGETLISTKPLGAPARQRIYGGPVPRDGPNEFSNVFGVAYRYLRYLGVRKRIRSTTTKQYGRLAEAEVLGELAQRSDRERRRGVPLLVPGS